MVRRLIEAIRELEYHTTLPNDDRVWLDEDYPYHDTQSFNVLEKVFKEADRVLMHPVFGIDALALETLSVAGCRWETRSLGRIVFLTRKGRILIVGPFQFI